MYYRARHPLISDRNTSISIRPLPEALNFIIFSIFIPASYHHNGRGINSSLVAHPVPFLSTRCICNAIHNKQQRDCRGADGQPIYPMSFANPITQSSPIHILATCTRPIGLFYPPQQFGDDSLLVVVVTTGFSVLIIPYQMEFRQNQFARSPSSQSSPPPCSCCSAPGERINPDGCTGKLYPIVSLRACRCVCLGKTESDQSTISINSGGASLSSPQKLTFNRHDDMI